MRAWVCLVIVSLPIALAFECNEAQTCKLSDGRVGMCRENTCIGPIKVDIKQNLVFSITVKYPETMLRKHGGRNLFIRGSGVGLQWNKGTLLSKTSQDTWMINITYQSTPGGFNCQYCLGQTILADNKLQYRVFIDDQNNMLGANFAVRFPVSETSSYFATKPDYMVYPWFYQLTGTIESITVNSTYIGDPRNVILYTPPSFNENTYKTYPALVVFDLNLDLAKYLKSNLESSIYPHAVSEEYALIGFGNYSGAGRTTFLTPTTGPTLVCINGTYGDGCGGCIPKTSLDNATEVLRYLSGNCGKRIIVGGDGDKTLDFLIQEALPVVRKHVMDRLKMDKIGVMGYSLGGLMSCYAAWTRPRVFTFAACQSPSFWWPYNKQNMDKADFYFINNTLKDPLFLDQRPQQKIYIDAGGAETMDPYRLTQAVAEAGQLISNHEHYNLNKNVWVFVDPNKNHSFVEWGKRMGQALATLLPADGAPNMPVYQGAPLVG